MTGLRRNILILLLLIIALAGGLAYQLRYNFIPKRFGTVVPNQLYRSGQLSPAMLQPTLEKHHIQLVIDFQGEKDHDPTMDNETQVCQQLHIEHHRYPLAGNGTGDIHHYADALADIVQAQRANKPVLIHCSAGTQRTGAATAFYRLLIEKKTASEAYVELTKYDWNPDKDQILIDYMNTHMRELADLLVARGVIDSPPQPLPKIGQ